MKLINKNRLCKHCNKFGLETRLEWNPVNCFVGMSDGEQEKWCEEENRHLTCRYCNASYKR